MKEEYGRAFAAFVDEDAHALDVEMAAGLEPAAGGSGELGFVHGAGTGYRTATAESNYLVCANLGPMIRDVHHVGIAVRDMEAAYALYRDALGLPLVKDGEVPARGVRPRCWRVAEATWSSFSRRTRARRSPSTSRSGARGCTTSALLS